MPTHQALSFLTSQPITRAKPATQKDLQTRAHRAQKLQRKTPTMGSGMRPPPKEFRGHSREHTNVQDARTARLSHSVRLQFPNPLIP